MPPVNAFFRLPRMFLEGVTMFAVAEMLSVQRQAVGRIVEDRTGLTGRNKMDLKFQFASPSPGQASTAPDSDGPSIFTAVREQWGLKLEPSEGSLEVVVVDGAQPPDNIFVTGTSRPQKRQRLPLLVRSDKRHVYLH
jgi:uncharacterized protein (TIGR03435 family)